MRSSIRRRLTITFVCIAILPLLVAGIAVACQSFTVQRQQVLALQSEVAQRIAVEASGYVDQVENELRQVVALHELAKHRPSAQRNLLSELQAYRQGYASLTLLDEVGRELIRVERLHVVPQDELRSRASEDAFRRPTETDRTYISPITFDQLTGEPALTVAVPIPDPRTGQNSRVLVAQVRVKKIWDLLRDVPVRGGETIYIVDSERRVVAHRQPSIVLRDTRVQLSGKDGFARGLDGGLVVQSVHPFTLGEQQLTVVVERPVGEAFRLLIGTAATTAVALLVTLGVSLGLGLVAVRQIVRPVESLAEVARAITAGDHSRRARVDTGDEIEHLADAFNTMNEQLRHTLESLHTVVANVPMFLYTADAGGRVTFIEGRALESLRQTPAEIIGHTLTALDPDSAELRQVAGAGLAGERLNGTVEIRGLTFELRSTPLLDHAGQVSGSIGVGIDITNRQILEAKLRHAQKLEAVGTLANGIAHDFNNVLAAIQGFAELAILDVPPDEPLHEDLRQITLAAQRGGALTRQLLTFSRPHATERQPINLALLAGEVMKMLRPVITRSIVLETDAEPGLATVDADPAQIQQVLTNLMINARDALPDGGTIHISIENVPLDSSFWGRHPGSEPGPYVRLRVADNGIGMDQATKNRIFEPFFTTKSGNKGSGLGLSVVHGIVASHQGMIEVDSAAGQGTAISVYLPAAAAEVSIAPAGSVPTLGNDELVLVIDDDAAVTQAARQALEHTGYRVLAAQNAPEAIALIRTRGRDVDAVLLDLTMPEISGRDVFAALRALRRDLPVIFSSGQSSAKLDAELLTPHTAFVAKPYTQNELTETLARLLATTRAGGADQ